MDPLPPIPTPLAQRWREFRIQVLPVVVFVGVLMAVVCMWKSYVVPSGVGGEVEAIRANVTGVPGTIAEGLDKRAEEMLASDKSPAGTNDAVIAAMKTQEEAFVGN